MKNTQKVTCCFVLLSTGLVAQQTVPSLSEAATRTSTPAATRVLAHLEKGALLPLPGVRKARAASVLQAKKPVPSRTQQLASAVLDSTLVRPTVLTGNVAEAALANASGEGAAPVVVTKKNGSVDPMLRTAASVSVQTQDRPDLQPESVSTHTFTGSNILQSAGTFQDLPRYLQTLPGVVGGSDLQNAAVVRGGNSTENLFVIDKIEVPNINHIALAGSTGGLGSMLDTNNIASVNFYTAAFSSSLQSHLSSVTDIRTIELPEENTYSVDMGYSGAGFRISRSVGLDKTLLVSARESITNLLTNDVGLNGSPEFTNSFAKYAWDASSRDHFWVDTLAGRDRLKVSPSATDVWETNAYDTRYNGWRDTTGMVWQHTYKDNAVGTWTLSNSQQQQDLNQIDQITGAMLFRQNNNDASSALRYEHLNVSSSGSSTSMGFDMRQNRIRYDVAQPNGVFSSYSTSTQPLDAFAAKPQFHTFDKAAFVESTLKFHELLTLTSGVRLQTWGFHPGLVPASLTPATAAVNDGVAASSYSTPNVPVKKASVPTGYQAYMPHSTLSMMLSRHVNLRASYGQYADLPAYANLATVPANANLGLIHSAQVVAGATVRIGSLFDISAEAYRKTYKGYPVAANLPTVSLANLLPTINEPFSAMPMVSEGRGRVQGVEISIKQATWHHVTTSSNLTFSRSLFSGRDGIYRPGNYDFPFVWNTLAGIQIKKLNLSLRNTMSSGRVYTGALIAESTAQNRLIYDLSQVNALRGPMYQRLDVAVNRDVMVRGRAMNIHAGLLNVMQRQNFYTEAWRPRCSFDTNCGKINEHQMGLVPDFGASYTF